MTIRSFLIITACMVSLSVLSGFVDAASTVPLVKNGLLLAKKPAKKLSDYGLFKDAAGRSPNSRVIPYRLNNPLFTDYALKFRYIYMPEGADPAPFQESEALDFPVGSVLVKIFAYPASFQQPTKNIRYIETRLLIHKKEGWKAYPYVWNEEQTEAYLKLAGKRLEIPVQWADSTEDVIHYAVPNVNQCKGCHTNSEKKFMPIGPKIRNLNGLYDYPELGEKNQLSYFQTLGYLAGEHSDFSKSPRAPRPFDPSDGDLTSRARSYLDANCAHCHSPGRPADTSGLYLDYTEKKEVHWGVNKPPVAAGRGSGSLKVDIKPGEPDQSIVVFRMKSTDPGIMMPELGRSLIDQEGIELIEEFIRRLK